MSAPVTERARAAVRGRTAAIPTQRGTAERATTRAGGAPPAQKPVQKPAPRPAPTAAQQKAYARRDDRLRRAAGAARPARTPAPAGRPQFVLLIMVLLAVGLVATLWLSTAAAADSYRLKDATERARVLREEAERLHREVAVLASAPELARRAAELGMTPVQDPARLVVAPDGSVEVVGEPRAAVPPPPPAPPAPPAGEQQPAPEGAEGAAPEGTAPEGTAPEGTTPRSTEPRAGTDDGSARLAAPARAGAPEAAGRAEGAGEPDRGAEPGGRSGDGAAADAAGPGGGGTDAG